MKIVDREGGLLSNVEVLEVLKDRQADKQAVISKALPSEIKAYQHLREQTPCAKSVDELESFLEVIKPFELTKLEKLHLLNYCPHTPLELFQCVHDCDTRLSEEDQDRLIQLVAEHLLSA